jgi:hypothetical protein
MEQPIEVTPELIEAFTAAWGAKQQEIGRGVAPKGTKTRAGLEAVFAKLAEQQKPVMYARFEDDPEWQRWHAIWLDDSGALGPGKKFAKNAEAINGMFLIESRYDA